MVALEALYMPHMAPQCIQAKIKRPIHSTLLDDFDFMHLCVTLIDLIWSRVNSYNYVQFKHGNHHVFCRQKLFYWYKSWIIIFINDSKQI